MADSTATPATDAAEAPHESNGRVLIGVVTRDKMDKTRRVEIPRLVRHPQYGKYIKRRTICYAHDETNDSHIGDTVEIVESRPLSKLKRWTLTRVINRAPARAVAAKPATPAKKKK